MNAGFTILRHSADEKLCNTNFFFLILGFSLALLTSLSAHADDQSYPSPIPVTYDRPTNALADADRHYRLDLLLNYMRHQGPALVPNLSDDLRGPANFLLGQIK